MQQRILLFDVGNTRVKWGVLDAARLVRTGGISHARLKDEGFNALTTRLPRQVDCALVSNVAGPGFAARLSRVLGIHCDPEIHFARCEKKAFGIVNNYRQPRQMGVDRWVAMIGARAEFKSALCVVDVGTALTIDAIDSKGQHLGGQIIPGLALMARSLDLETSGVSVADSGTRADFGGLKMFTGTTRRAVQSGALNALCGAVERAAKTMRSEGLRPKIILTGGDSSRILKMLGGKIVHRPNLVLQGLAFMSKTKS